MQTVAMTGPSGATASIALMAARRGGQLADDDRGQGAARRSRRARRTRSGSPKDGKLADPCGTFVVGPGTTEVPLNAPYRLKEYDGWVIVRTGTKQPFLLRTTTV